MINSVMTIGGHLTDRKLCDAKGATLTLPELYPALYQFRVKLIDRNADGKNAQVYPNVETLVSSMGLVYAQPRAGSFKLRYGTGTRTAVIDFNEDSDSFRTKLAALSESTTLGLDVVYSPSPSTWVCRFNTPGVFAVPLNGIENELEPETFIRIREFTQNAEDWVEIRLLQGPIASTNDHDTFLPLPPSVRTIRDGSTEDDGIQVIRINEIQAITVPPDFTGTYIVKFQGRQSIALSGTDGAQVIQDALNNMYEDGLIRFTVTNPELNNAYVQFVGPFSGLNMDELQLIIPSTGQADLFFQINLATTEVAEALQRNPSVQCKFEVRIHVSDPAVEDDPGQDLTLFQEPVTIIRPLHWEGLEEAAPINWLFPPNAKDYIPFSQDQIIVGDLTYSIAFGDGLLNDYVIAHDLNSDALSVEVRENINSGRKLRDDEYNVVFDNANALTITVIGDPPASNRLLVSIFASGPVSAFLNHTHTIGQIIGLQEILDSILARLAALEALLPTIIGLIPGQSPFGTDPNADILKFQIDKKWDLVPTNRLPTGDFDPTAMAPAGLLLPAVHDVIDLGLFTANATTNEITLAVAHGAGFVAGQRARIYVPEYTTVGACTFDYTLDLITCTSHGLVDGRKVKFSGGVLPDALSPYAVYYVINSATHTFQISATLGGSALPLITNGTGSHTVLTVAEAPGGLEAGVDYFMTSGPTTTVFKLALTIGGAVIDITSAGYGPLSISSVEEAPSTSGTLPAPGSGNAGNAYSVREDIYLPSRVGIRSETVVAGDLIASDGRLWYHVTRSDSPGSNSFYANQMEKEIFRLAINDNMLKAGSVFTMTFELGLQMFKHDTNVQYNLVIDIAELPQVSLPTPTGPNLFEVEWNTTPVLQQRIIVTDVLLIHKFGVQVVNSALGILRTNKKLYGVEVAGDVIPETANFALRCRLIEFDTEDNVADATGLIYYTLNNASGGISRSSPTAPITTPVP